MTTNAVDIKRPALCIALGLALFTGAFGVSAQAPRPPKTSVMWINHLELLAGDPTVKTSFNAISSGVGGGLSGLIIQSTTTGDISGGGNKVVETGLQVPPGFLVKGVRVCYESSNKRTFITQISLSQVQDPPGSAVSRLDDGTDHTNAGPVCVDSKATSADPTKGALILDLRLNFGNTADRIVIRALGLRLGT